MGFLGGIAETETPFCLMFCLLRSAKIDAMADAKTTIERAGVTLLKERLNELHNTRE
jgi:hypothetical protein